MKKNLLYIFSLASVLCSCNDFLDKEPLDAVPTDKYLLAESDLAAYSANLYDQLPSHTPGQYSMGEYLQQTIIVTTKQQVIQTVHL